MAVKGLKMFIDYFREYHEAFILIGGAACDIWFTEQNLVFRATKDLDLVLILENLNPEFISRIWEFIEAGNYEIKNRSEDSPPILFRFARPKHGDYPFMLELFCREIPQLNLEAEQHIIPVRMEDSQSLSAILLHNSYYQFLLKHCRKTRDILVADGTVLIPLKTRAWLDLTRRRTNGEEVKESDIRKHRNDVFRLAVTLPDEPGTSLPKELADDVMSFIDQHPPEHLDWEAINQAIRSTVGGNIQPKELVSAIRTYYQLG